MMSEMGHCEGLTNRAGNLGLRFTLIEHMLDHHLEKAMKVIMCVLALCIAIPSTLGAPRDSETVKSEHDTIGVGKETAASHTMHPDAQWFPDAGLGLFIHWGISSVKASNISWPMIPGRALSQKRIEDPAERDRIIREGDWNLNGKPNSVTPNEYWSWAK